MQQENRYQMDVENSKEVTRMAEIEETPQELMDLIRRAQDSLNSKKHALLKTLAGWWLDLDKYQHLQPGTRASLQTAIDDMRAWLAALEQLASEPVPQDDDKGPPNWKATEAQAKADLDRIETDQDAIRFIQIYFSKGLRPGYLELYRSDRHEMNRTPRQAIDNLLSLPPIQ